MLSIHIFSSNRRSVPADTTLVYTPKFKKGCLLNCCIVHCTSLHNQTATHHGCNEFVHCYMSRPLSIVVNIASIANTRMSLSHSRHLQCYLKIRYIHGALRSGYATMRNAQCNNSEDNLFWIRCILHFCSLLHLKSCTLGWRNRARLNPNGYEHTQISLAVLVQCWTHFSSRGPSPPKRSEERRKNGARTGLGTNWLGKGHILTAGLIGFIRLLL